MSVALEQFPQGSITPQPVRPRYSIVVPAYNERARIGQSLEQIVDHVRTHGLNAEVVVVDDGSKDDTLKLVSNLALDNPEIRIIQNPGNQGKGYSVRNGMLNARGEILLFTDADLSSPIAECSKLFRAIEQGADVAIGSRWIDTSLQFQRQSLKRRILSRIYNLFLRVALWFPYRDTQCGFKAFNRRAAEVIFPRQRITRWGFDPEILFLATRNHLKVVEVPVRWGHDDRSKINPLRDGMHMGLDVLRILWFSVSGQYRGAGHATSAQSGTK
jgi:glycosyltransferase involved in cell wall biosynthesis